MVQSRRSRPMPPLAPRLAFVVQSRRSRPMPLWRRAWPSRCKAGAADHAASDAARGVRGAKPAEPAMPPSDAAPGVRGAKPAVPAHAPSGGRRAWPPGNRHACNKSSTSRPDVHLGSGLRLHPPALMVTAPIALRCARAGHETGGALRHAASGARASAPPAHSRHPGRWLAPPAHSRHPGRWLAPPAHPRHPGKWLAPPAIPASRRWLCSACYSPTSRKMAAMVGRWSIA
jgi:hypothetical protein